MEAMETATENRQPENKQPEKKSNNSLRSRLLIGTTVVILLIGIVFLCLWILYFQYHESTDDAFASGNLTNVNSAISGNIISFNVQDTNLVKEGELIVSLDKSYYAMVYKKELETLASVVLQVNQLYEQVNANQILVDNKKTILSRAQYDYGNRSQLVSSKAISNEDFTHSKDNLLIAQLDLQFAEAQLKLAQDAAGNTLPQEHPLLEKQKSAVRIAFYNLQHCCIYAPTTGYVAKKAVGVGQWVSPNTNLMAIIPSQGVWVDANFKETQLTYMRVGQPATVWFDLYGSKIKFQGKVLGIASGTGSVFSIIPPQNATGNWIKIVQRLPVRISLDSEQVQKYPIRMGISAEVDVDISNQELPRLVEVLSTQPVVKTKIFNLDFTEADHEIKKILQDNLKTNG